MTKIATLKAQAKHLKAAMEEMGITLTLAQAQEAVAKQYGMPNWDTVAGVLKKKPAAGRAPVLADMPGIPDSIWVEQGPRAQVYRVEHYEDEALALLHDEEALKAYLEKHKKHFTEALDSVAISLDGDESMEFTFRELQGMTYRRLGGRGCWLLSDGDTYLSFNCGSGWVPEETLKVAPSELKVPELVKSAKGCQLLEVPSADGAGYMRHVIVPPNLDVREVARQLDEELIRLKALEGPDGDSEYDEDDLKAFLAQRGCIWVNEYIRSRVEWD